MELPTQVLPGSGRLLERAGTFLSFACAVHCMATPILLSILPLAARAHANHHHSNGRLEFLLMGGSALLGAVVLVRGYLRHHRSLALALFAGAFGLMALAKAPLASPAPLLLTVLGSLLLGWAYWDNHLAGRHCPCCTDTGGA